MKKRWIIFGIVAAIFVVAMVYTVVFPADYELAEVRELASEEGTFSILERRKEQEEGIVRLDAYQGAFPSNVEEDYRRVILCFSAKSHGLLRLTEPIFAIENIGEDLERLVYCDVAQNLSGEFSEELCNASLIFYIGGMSEEEIRSYLQEALQKVTYTIWYEQALVGTREHSWRVSESELAKVKWIVE